MSNAEAAKALINSKLYASAEDVAAIDYAIAVLMKLEAQGVAEPLTTDFSSLKEGNR